MARDLRIGELAAGTGLDPRTIRYYEQVGLLPEARRSRPTHASPGYRLYSEKDVELLRLIKGARLLDLSLAEIKQLLPYLLDGRGVRSRLQLVLREKLAALDGRIKDLQLLRARLDHLQDVFERNTGAPEAGCCDPLCGPQTCPPPLATLKVPGRDERAN